MEMKKMTGREIRELVKTMDPTELLLVLKDTLEKSIPLFTEMPEDEKHSPPVALVFITEELARRYAALTTLTEVAGEVAKVIKEAVVEGGMRTHNESVPAKDRS